jgi:hypothetical protein
MTVVVLGDSDMGNPLSEQLLLMYLKPRPNLAPHASSPEVSLPRPDENLSTQVHVRDVRTLTVVHLSVPQHRPSRVLESMNSSCELAKAHPRREYPSDACASIEASLPAWTVVHWQDRPFVGKLRNTWELVEIGEDHSANLLTENFQIDIRPWSLFQNHVRAEANPRFLQLFSDPR